MQHTNLKNGEWGHDKEFAPFPRPQSSQAAKSVRPSSAQIRPFACIRTLVGAFKGVRPPDDYREVDNGRANRRRMIRTLAAALTNPAIGRYKRM